MSIGFAVLALLPACKAYGTPIFDKKHYDACISTPLDAVMYVPYSENSFVSIPNDFTAGKRIALTKYSQIFPAFRLSDNKKVCLKMTLQVEGHDEFHREVCLLSAILNHPGIPEFIGIDVGRNFMGIVMEFVPGKNLKEILDATTLQQKEKNWDLIPVLLRDIGSVLDWLHQNGLVYRDVKPDNIMVLPGRKTMKLIDFGYTGRSDRDEVALCTPTFVSPELYKQCSISGTPNPFSWSELQNTDWYALGATLYHLVTGEPLLANDKDEEMHKSMREGFDPDFLDNRGPYSAVLKGLLDRSVATRWKWEQLESWMKDNPSIWEPRDASLDDEPVEPTGFWIGVKSFLDKLF